MIVAIHQPNFLPWIGFFYKFSQADHFVFLDDVQFSKNSFINRNKIKTPRGESWLTLPVCSAGKFTQKINEVRINNFPSVRTTVISTVKMNYAKSKYFNSFFGEFEKILNGNDDNLSKLNIDLILWICKVLNFNPKISFSSDMKNIEGNATDRLINICKSLNATTYLSGFGGVKYQEQELFAQNKIELKQYDFIHPQYLQLWGEFIPNLSAIDLLFNCGEQSRNSLLNRV